jgi:hypothetical protein
MSALVVPPLMRFLSFAMGVINDKSSITACDKITASAFARYATAVLLHANCAQPSALRCACQAEDG